MKTMEKHSDINHSNIFFDPSLRTMEIKTKINKEDLFKLKSFCVALFMYSLPLYVDYI